LFEKDVSRGVGSRYPNNNAENERCPHGSASQCYTYRSLFAT